MTLEGEKPQNADQANIITGKRTRAQVQRLTVSADKGVVQPARQSSNEKSPTRRVKARLKMSVPKMAAAKEGTQRTEARHKASTTSPPPSSPPRPRQTASRQNIFAIDEDGNRHYCQDDSDGACGRYLTEKEMSDQAAWDQPHPFEWGTHCTYCLLQHVENVRGFRDKDYAYSAADYTTGVGSTLGVVILKARTGSRPTNS